jgi:hypothetical protein
MKDLAGSCVNVPGVWPMCEAPYMLEQGLASPSRLDLIARRFIRMGPCKTLDTIGVPLFTSIGRNTIDGFAFDLRVPELCHKLIRDGRLGRSANQGVYLYRDDRPVDDAPEYYLTQTPPPSGVRSDDASVSERLMFSIYFAILKIASMGLSSVGDLCLGITDLLGLKTDPLEELRKLGSAGLRDEFDRLRAEPGPRYGLPPAGVDHGQPGRPVTYRFVIAAVLNWMVVGALFAVGIRYLASKRVMIYHLQILDVAWTDLTPRTRILMLTLMKGTAQIAPPMSGDR